MTDTAIPQDANLDENEPPKELAADAPEEEFLGISWPPFIGLISVLLLVLFLGGTTMLLIVFSIIGFLVFHEAGHYLTAKWSGMKVTEFFIGFGKPIFAFKRGETTFGMKLLIPFGAYVRIIGMNNLEEVDPADEHRTYRQAPWYKRVLTIVAGPATHFVTAFGLLAFVLWQYGPNAVDEDAFAIENVAAASPFAEAGLVDGDRIVSIGRESTETWERFVEVVGEFEGQEASITFQRFERGQVVRRTGDVVVPTAAGADPEEVFAFDRGIPEWEVFEWAIGDVTPLSAAAAAGLESGDRLLAIDGVPTPFFSDVASIIPEIRGQEVELLIERDGEQFTAETRIWERLTAAGAAGLNGVYIGEQIVSIEGVPVANYAEFVELAQDRIGETVEVEVVYDSAVNNERIVINELVTENAVSGFLGVSAGTAQDQPLGLASAVTQAPGQIVDLVRAIAGGVRTLVTTEAGIRGLFALGSPDETDLTVSGVTAEELPEFRPRSTQDPNRPISLLGAVILANQLETQAIVSFLAILNLFFGLFNLLPLLPFDGGHVALATYERIRSFGRSERYYADAAKLLPMTYVVLGLFAVVGTIAFVRDILDPIQL